MLVETLLEESAQARPDHIALVCGDRRLTYAAVNDAAEQVAGGLRARGIRPGDRVVVQLENTVEAVVALFATLKARAVFVPVGRSVKADKLAYIVQDCRAAAIVLDQRVLQAAAQALEGLSLRLTAVVDGTPPSATPHFTCSFEELFEPAPSALDRGIDCDLAALVYTSGSTGRPKGVMLSHGNIIAAAASISTYLRMSAADVILNMLPLSFDYGLYQVLLAFGAGARLVLEKGFAYPLVTLDLMAREGVTVLPVVPTLASLLLRQDFGASDLPRLRCITSTGAPLPVAHIRELRTRLPGAQIFSMYGLTECKRVSFLDPDEIDARPTSVGKPMDNVDVFVADASGRLSTQGQGELVIRGANVMQGYWNAPESTARVLRPGPMPGEMLLYTGDTFRVDEDGFMYFVGRADDMIKSGGQRVSPREVEDAIYEIPGVTQAAVVGVPHPVLGMVVKAFIVADAARGLTRRAVMRHCASRLEDFMVPSEVEFVNALPTTDSGKLTRRGLAPLPVAMPVAHA